MASAPLLSAQKPSSLPPAAPGCLGRLGASAGVHPCDGGGGDIRDIPGAATDPPAPRHYRDLVWKEAKGPPAPPSTSGRALPVMTPPRKPLRVAGLWSVCRNRSPNPTKMLAACQAVA